MYYFGCSTQCEGDVFCGLDSREEHKKRLADTVAKRGLFGNIDEALERPGLAAMLPPGMHGTYCECEKLYKKSSKVGMMGSFVTDLSQDGA